MPSRNIVINNNNRLQCCNQWPSMDDVEFSQTTEKWPTMENVNFTQEEDSKWPTLENIQFTEEDSKWPSMENVIFTQNDERWPSMDNVDFTQDEPTVILDENITQDVPNRSSSLFSNSFQFPSFSPLASSSPIPSRPSSAPTPFRIPSPIPTRNNQIISRFGPLPLKRIQKIRQTNSRAPSTQSSSSSTQIISPVKQRALPEYYDLSTPKSEPVVLTEPEWIDLSSIPSSPIFTLGSSAIDLDGIESLSGLTQYIDQAIMSTPIKQRPPIFTPDAPIKKKRQSPFPQQSPIPSTSSKFRAMPGKTLPSKRDVPSKRDIPKKKLNLVSSQKFKSMFGIDKSKPSKRQAPQIPGKPTWAANIPGGKTGLIFNKKSKKYETRAQISKREAENERRRINYWKKKGQNVPPKRRINKNLKDGWSIPMTAQIPNLSDSD